MQQTILDVVNRHPGRFSRRDLARVLVRRKSWQERGLTVYSRFAHYRRKEIGFQVEVLRQQGYLELDGRSCLVPVVTTSGVKQIE
jgi:hypothetical protein